MIPNCGKCKLKDLKLYKEGDVYYLSATYQYENETGVYEVEIPKIKFPVIQDSVAIDIDTKSAKICPDVSVAMGFGYFDVEYNKDGKWFNETLIHEKIHEMTLEEIEKKLGYKVKVVSEKRGIIKSYEMCSKCAFGLRNNKLCHKCSSCAVGKDETGTCKCVSISLGEFCPHFKEA